MTIPTETEVHGSAELAIEKFCISCNQAGHTYLECQDHPFIDIFCSAFGIPNLLGNKPKDPL